MKLNLGDGGVEIAGYVGRDIKRGESVTVLPYENDSIDEIRASHILEHFGVAEIPQVLKEWVRCLKPGGILKIAVPDFQLLAEKYLAGAPINPQPYVMGGQSTEYDFHKTIYDYEALTEALYSVGLVGITRWFGEGEDSASSEISLNLQGTKPRAAEDYPKVVGLLSMPRLGFNTFWSSAYKELAPLGIEILMMEGAYWDNGLANAMQTVLDWPDPPKWVLTMDYDTVFRRNDFLTMLETVLRLPHIDALAPIQSARHANTQLFTLEDTESGEKITKVSRQTLRRGAVIKSYSAHFGLTLIKAEKLRELPKPWFERDFGTADTEGCDPDVNFWRKWRAAGNTLYTALRVPVGHCELMIRWPSQTMGTSYQRTQEWKESGPPRDVWT